MRIFLRSAPDGVTRPESFRGFNRPPSVKPCFSYFRSSSAKRFLSSAFSSSTESWGFFDDPMVGQIDAAHHGGLHVRLMGSRIAVAIDHFVNSGILLSKPARAERIPTFVDQFATHVTKTLLNAIPIKRTCQKTDGDPKDDESDDDDYGVHGLDRQIYETSLFKPILIQLSRGKPCGRSSFNHSAFCMIR